MTHFKATDPESSNLVALLDKLASQPNGVQDGLKLVTLLASKPNPQPTPEGVNRNRLIAIALDVASKKGIEKPPYFKGMSDDAIQEFIRGVE